MATLSFIVPDAIALDVLNALKWKYPNVDISGRTNIASAKRIIREMLKDVYRDYLWAQKNIELETQFNATRQAEKEALEVEVRSITD